MEILGAVAGIIALLSLLTGISAWKLVVIALAGVAVGMIFECAIDDNGASLKKYRRWRGLS